MDHLPSIIQTTLYVLQTKTVVKVRNIGIFPYSSLSDKTCPIYCPQVVGLDAVIALRLKYGYS